ncbi:MAG: hypothetical protein ACRCVT_09680 [Leadbetterella sp.]
MIHHSNENTIMDDANSPEINKALMGKISADFVKVCDHLKETSYQIRQRKFSQNPIFILHLQDVELGSLLFESKDFSTIYTYKASMLEEFISRNLVGEESGELFKEHYKDPDEYCCLFVMDGEFAGFVYLPYPND